ncbi:type IV pilin N-terminal domain-containing protein [Methanoculleus sp.]|uniref:type IV pilin N-terminal domain-containing protein n=1 Tax=Methanoculleus sp. TaxID=90427 RepID=UPI0025F1A770|nr:type IV pilin N-terminal domain-containing protein [Methanoculleus sp.]
MLNFKQNEDAVSPVIGVILMVAITVILAAVIAAFVFGMGSNIDTTKTVGVTASLNTTQHLIVTIQGGGDVASLTELNMSVNGANFSAINGSKIYVGAQLISNAKINPGEHVVVVAHFEDGSQQVVLDRFY